MSQSNILICFIFACMPLYVLAKPVEKPAYPYEKCKWDNQDFTNRVVKESQDFISPSTEAKALCIECDKKILYQNRTKKYLISDVSSAIAKANDIPEVCFLAGALSKIKKQAEKYSNNWYYCFGSNSNEISKKMHFTGTNETKCAGKNHSTCRLDESRKTNLDDKLNQDIKWKKQPWAFAQRVCLSKDYIGMTAKAFNETANCFGYNSKKDKEQLFALMNHESGFLVNKKPASNKKASCYGQIDANRIALMNAYIQYPKTYPKSHKIYQDAINKCPHLSHKVHLVGTCANQKGASLHDYRDCLSKEVHSDALMCKTSQDAYSCLFYSVYIFKKYQARVNEIFKQIQDKPIDLKLDKNKNLSQLFKWPVKFNEMLTVKGSFKGPLPIFKDNIFLSSLSSKSVLTNELTAHGAYKSSVPVIEALNQYPLEYDKKNLQVQKVQIFDEYQLKWFFIHLAKKEGVGTINKDLPAFMEYMKDKILKEEDYKKIILNGSSLDSSVLISEFNSYVKEHKATLEENPANLIQDMNQSLQALKDPDKLEKGIKHIYKHQDFSRGDIGRFNTLVKKHCPSSI